MWLVDYILAVNQQQRGGTTCCHLCCSLNVQKVTGFSLKECDVCERQELECIHVR